jgi:hypothetical protein
MQRNAADGFFTRPSTLIHLIIQMRLPVNEISPRQGTKTGKKNFDDEEFICYTLKSFVLADEQNPMPFAVTRAN